MRRNGCSPRRQIRHNAVTRPHGHFLTLDSVATYTPHGSPLHDSSHRILVAVSVRKWRSPLSLGRSFQSLTTRCAGLASCGTTLGSTLGLKLVREIAFSRPQVRICRARLRDPVRTPRSRSVFQTNFNGFSRGRVGDIRERVSRSSRQLEGRVRDRGALIRNRWGVRADHTVNHTRADKFSAIGSY